MTEQPLAEPRTATPANHVQSIVDTVLDLDEFLSGDVRRARKSARICIKPDLEAKLDGLQQELESLTDERGEPLTAPGDEAMGGGRTAATVAREYRDVQQEYAAAMRQIVVEAMPSPQWKAWHKANEKALELDDVPDEVYNDLIVKCAVAPSISADKLEQLRERIGHAQVNELALAAWEVNTKSGVSVPKSLLSSHVLKRQARDELALAEKLAQPPSYLRGSTTEARHVYDTQGRLERTITVSPWTSEDHALMLAWQRYQAGIDARCSQPIEKAWHPKNDAAEYDTKKVTCHACTAKRQAEHPGNTEPVTHYVVVDVRDHDAHPLPPFDPDDFD